MEGEHLKLEYHVHLLEAIWAHKSYTSDWW